MVVLFDLAMYPARPLPKDASSISEPGSLPNGLHVSHHNSVQSRRERTRNYRATTTSESSDDDEGRMKKRVASCPDGLYSALTHLDEWSPNSVSISSLLSRSRCGNRTELHRNATAGIFAVLTAEAAPADSRIKTEELEASPWNHPYLPGWNWNRRDHVVRRSTSCGPCDTGNPRDVGPHTEPFSSSAIPRVYSAGDLESRHPARDRSSCLRENGFRVQKTPVHSIALPGPLRSSQAISEMGRNFLEESNISYSNGCSNGYSSGYGSDSGSRHSQYSDSSTHNSRAARREKSDSARAMSAERAKPFLRSRSFEYGGRGALLVRRRSSQTLQTVVEHLAHVTTSPDMQRPRYDSSDRGYSNSNSGANTPRSASNNSSRRSSLTSRNGGNSDSYSTISSSDLQWRLESMRRWQGRSSETGTSPSESSGSWKEAAGSGRTSRDSRLPLPQILPLIWPRRPRSKSLPDLQVDPAAGSGRAGSYGSCYSDDEDGDDFGFLSRPFSFFSPSAAAMHKPKVTASSPTQRLLPRRWRGKAKASSSAHPAQAMWSPEGPCTWCSVSGRKVLLKPVSILQLSEAERLALQKIALAKLQAMNLACPIVIPKDAGDTRQHKKRTLSLKRRSKSANLSTLLDTLSTEKGKDKENKDGKPAGLVFGIPLSRCIANDRELLNRRARNEQPVLQTRSESADQLLSPRQARKSSSSSQGSMDNGVHNGNIAPSGRHSLYDSARRAQSSDSLSESEYSSRNTSSTLIDALSLSVSNAEGESSQAVGSTPQVPLIVDACFKHLETYGLHVLGIFRVGSSKKRVKQLREEFDSGKDVRLTEEHNPHDIGALLKEFFRDLPEPLLTRDLYLPFVATRRVEDREQQAEAVRLLLTLLPPPNRDTLWALLRFLATVHRNSADCTDSSGQEVSGNKMDSHNLATLFGPNVLHRTRAVAEKQFMVECAEQAEQSAEVISVVKDMIDNHYDLFEISAEQRDEVLRLMMEADQENLDRALRRLAHENQIEPDPESTCSVFEDVTDVPQSLPHSANSDADLLSLAHRKSVTTTHRPLRVSRSADPWMDPLPPSSSAQAATSAPADRGRVPSVDSAAERTSQSPSPTDSPPSATPPRTLPSFSRPGSTTRPPLVTVSPGSPNPEVLPRVTSGRRRHPDGGGATTPRASVSDDPAPPGGHVRERPHSEVLAGSLVIPRPTYQRENSGSSAGGSCLSSSGGHSSQLGSSDSAGGLWVLPTPPVSRGASPQAIRRSPSSVPAGLTHAGQLQQHSPRRRTLASSSRSDDDEAFSPPVGSPEWQRERWRHWEELTAGRNGAAETEQETLV